MTDQTYFKFDTHDLETIHRSVVRWCSLRGIEISHPVALTAARQAFKVYDGRMEEEELASLLSQLDYIAH